MKIKFSIMETAIPKMKKKKYTKIKSCCLLVAASTYCLLVANAVNAEPSETNNCLQCHQKDYDKTLMKRYIHSPFLNKKCAECHLGGDSSQGEDVESQKEKKHFREINWLEKQFSTDTIHWFFMPLNKIVGKTVYIRIPGRTMNKTKVKELVAPSFDTLDQLASTNTPPESKAIKVLSVDRGIFLSARIGWRTDSISQGWIIYGTEKLNHLSDRDNQFTQYHEILLTGLKSNKKYQFEVVNEDLFGNKIKSKTLTFSTEQSFSLLAKSQERNNASLDVRDLKTDFYRYKDKYIIKVSAPEPVALLFGISPGRNGSSIVKTEKIQSVTNHSRPLNRIDDILSNCENCHRDVKLSLSHPVNVVPKRGMIIPPEYPTLPDGRITCMSCHAIHGSNYEYRLLKSSKKELCIGCHKDMA